MHPAARPAPVTDRAAERAALAAARGRRRRPARRRRPRGRLPRRDRPAVGRDRRRRAGRGRRRRRRAAPHRDDDQPVRRARLDARARAAASRRPRPHRGGRRRAARTQRARGDPARPALDHDALGPRAVRRSPTARRATRSSPGAIARDDGAAHEHDRGARASTASTPTAGPAAGSATRPRCRARELVVTFGHGPHRCPAQRFSLSAIGRAVRRLLDTYELTPEFDAVRPLPGQIGGVARAADPCPVRYAASPVAAHSDQRTRTAPRQTSRTDGSPDTSSVAACRRFQISR